MNIDQSNPVFNKVLFSLNKDNTPSDQNKFHDGLIYLANNALEALKKPDEVKRAFQTIEKLNSKEHTSNDTDTLVQKVFEKWIKIQLCDKSRYIPKEHLQKHCGKKFQGQFTINMKDKNSRTLELSPPEGVNITDICEVVREGFLSYLQTGVVPDDAVEENVMDLMGLAYQHQVDSLVEHCSSIIQANLDKENLEIVLEFIKNRNLPSLRWACFEFIFAHPENIPEGLTKDDQEVLNLLISLSDTLGINMSTQGKLMVFVRNKSLGNSIFMHLEKINNNYPISSLQFLYWQDEEFSFFDEISNKLENIEELIINYHLYDLNLNIEIQEKFPKLTSFGNNASILLNFDKVIGYLKNFRNPEEADSSLKKLTLRSLNLRAIHNLTDAQLEGLTPYLQEIYHLTINSENITKLIAPKALIVNCGRCTSLETLQANQAIKVDCSGCTSLKTLQVNQAREVYCGSCDSLENLQANQAKKVHCYNCEKLKTLQVNQAEMLGSYSCTSLKTLQANQAITIDCRYCTSLENLQAIKAISVNCEGCTNLKTLIANSAENVFCEGCTSLTNFNGYLSLLPFNIAIRVFGNWLFHWN